MTGNGVRSDYTTETGISMLIMTRKYGSERTSLIEALSGDRSLLATRAMRRN
jgi:hypothetical protein